MLSEDQGRNFQTKEGKYLLVWYHTIQVFNQRGPNLKNALMIWPKKSATKYTASTIESKSLTLQCTKLSRTNSKI